MATPSATLGVMAVVAAVLLLLVLLLVLLPELQLLLLLLLVVVVVVGVAVANPLELPILWSPLSDRVIRARSLVSAPAALLARSARTLLSPRALYPSRTTAATTLAPPPSQTIMTTMTAAAVAAAAAEAAEAVLRRETGRLKRW